MQTKSPLIFLVGIALLVGIFIGIGSRSVHSQAVQPKSPASDVGRYQLVPVGSGPNADLYFLDTKTGRCWTRNPSDGKWYPIGPSNLRQ
jgi:hypothetical protein